VDWAIRVSVTRTNDGARSGEAFFSAHKSDKVGFWSVSPDVTIEICFLTDNCEQIKERAHAYITQGTTYAVAIAPEAHIVCEFGTRPDGLKLDFGAMCRE
jgi:hypothetical protein